MLLWYVSNINNCYKCFICLMIGLQPSWVIWEEWRKHISSLWWDFKFSSSPSIWGVGGRTLLGRSKSYNIHGTFSDPFPLYALYTHNSLWSLNTWNDHHLCSLLIVLFIWGFSRYCLSLACYWCSVGLGTIVFRSWSLDQFWVIVFGLIMDPLNLFISVESIIFFASINPWEVLVLFLFLQLYFTSMMEYEDFAFESYKALLSYYDILGYVAMFCNAHQTCIEIWIPFYYLVLWLLLCGFYALFPTEPHSLLQYPIYLQYVYSLEEIKLVDIGIDQTFDHVFLFSFALFVLCFSFK